MRRFILLGIFQAALCAGVSAQPVCVGDCSGGDQVTVDEVLRGVAIALGSLEAGACEVVDSNADGLVTVDELLEAVNVALNGCTIGTASGICLRPGDEGLIPCAPGTEVGVFRCDAADTCTKATAQRTRVGTGAVDETGSFAARYDAGRTGSKALIVEAKVDEAHVERDVVFGPAGAGAVNTLNGLAATDIAIEGIVLSPVSEAAVRILDENGLQNFSASGAQQVADAVIAANADTSFAGLDVEAAATLATTTAQADPTVQSVIQQAKFTPTPTATATPTTSAPTEAPTPTNTPTNTPKPPPTSPFIGEFTGSFAFTAGPMQGLTGQVTVVIGADGAAGAAAQTSDGFAAGMIGVANLVTGTLTMTQLSEQLSGVVAVSVQLNVSGSSVTGSGTVTAQSDAGTSSGTTTITARADITSDYTGVYLGTISITAGPDSTNSWPIELFVANDGTAAGYTFDPEGDGFNFQGKVDAPSGAFTLACNKGFDGLSGITGNLSGNFLSSRLANGTFNLSNGDTGNILFFKMAP